MLLVVVERKRVRIVEREAFKTCRASTPKEAEIREARLSNPES
jgi:hypothetical protein